MPSSISCGFVVQQARILWNVADLLYSCSICYLSWTCCRRRFVVQRLDMSRCCVFVVYCRFVVDSVAQLVVQQNPQLIEQAQFGLYFDCRELSQWVFTTVYNILSVTQGITRFVCDNWDLFKMLSADKQKEFFPMTRLYLRATDDSDCPACLIRSSTAKLDIPPTLFVLLYTTDVSRTITFPGQTFPEQVILTNFYVPYIMCVNTSHIVLVTRYIGIRSVYWCVLVSLQ